MFLMFLGLVRLRAPHPEGQFPLRPIAFLVIVSSTRGFTYDGQTNSGTYMSAGDARHTVLLKSPPSTARTQRGAYAARCVRCCFGLDILQDIRREVGQYLAEANHIRETCLSVLV